MQRVYTDEIKAQLTELAKSDLYTKRAPRSQGLVGKRYGKLVIQRPVGHTEKSRRLLVLCHCDCGGAKIATVDRLKSGVVSCGCELDKRQPKRVREREFSKMFLQAVKSMKGQSNE